MDPEVEDDPWAISWQDIEMDGKEIGRGQFGAVFQGLLFGSEVAVKKLLKLADAESDAKYMKREQELLRQLAHPNIVQFIGLCAHDGFLWLVSEYVAKGCLCKLLYDSEPLSWARRIHFALDTVQALAFIHSKGLMHRDIKSENLLLDTNDKVKLCDFGFARRVEKKLERTANKKQHALTIAGTDEWMAPEVIVGTPYGQPADIFSFGVTLTEMILRRKPEERRPRNAFDFETEEFRQALPRDCPPPLAALVLECCKYEPAQRPEAKLMVRGLKELHKMVAEQERAVAAGASAAASAAAASAAATAEAATASAVDVASPRRTAVPSDTQTATAAPSSGAPPPVVVVSSDAFALSPGRLSGSGSSPTPAALPAGPYVGLTPTSEDEAAASALPDENGLFRGVTGFSRYSSCPVTLGRAVRRQ